jgi:uncharacterized protein YnzC (UPF0291/DUF896 family)
MTNQYENDEQGARIAELWNESKEEELTLEEFEEIFEDRDPFEFL